MAEESKSMPEAAQTAPMENQEEEKKEEVTQFTSAKKAGGLQKPPGAARRLKAPPTSNLHQLRNLREKLQNKGESQAAE